MLNFIKLEPGKKKPDQKSLSDFYTNINKLNDAAILLNNEVVVVDFDERPEIGFELAKRYPTFTVKTQRGIHLYYKRPKQINGHNILLRNQTKKLTSIGCSVDYKTGNKATATVKQNGVLREMSQPLNELSFDDLPTIPVELLPSKLKNVLADMQEGSRNASLFTHLLAVREMYEVDADTITKLAEFINEFIFTDKLPQSEINQLVLSVLDKEVREKQYLDPKDMIVTSEVLADELEIKFFNGALFHKEGNSWIQDRNKLLRIIDKRIKLLPNKWKQLIDLFPVKGELIETYDFPIQFRNNFMLDGDEIIPMASKEFTPYLLDVNYDPDAYDKTVDEFLDFLSSDKKDLRNVIEEMLGHVIMTKGFPHKVFFMVGNTGANGKSTFLEMLNSWVGDLGLNLALEQFNDQTSVMELEGKLVNVGDDIDSGYMEKSMNFKTLASGNTIMVRPIYSKPYKLKNKATLIFTANEMPTFKDKSGGIARRVVVIPCENKVKKADPKIDEKLATDNAKSYLLNIALKAMERIINNGGQLTTSEEIEKVTQEYFVESDSILGFTIQEGIDEQMITKGVYEEYCKYCDDLGAKPFSQTKFTQRLKSMGYETRDKRMMGRKYKVYEKIVVED
ncbi:phage/plasmid primase, P4 family [Vagococcus fluvialis]|uniref:phage/plasmid primase, P4 family n=1 Tax=Vagococcus fluvialis TaxID=2738 RepID=UPI00288CF67E|nr:phage/plasmid primase, P4 family [Vagococcus fluvialis]MDT2747053.1 phage/plasmid primase, P4 family [Vagococcus fluvialis]